MNYLFSMGFRSWFQWWFQCRTFISIRETIWVKMVDSWIWFLVVEDFFEWFVSVFWGFIDDLFPIERFIVWTLVWFIVVLLCFILEERWIFGNGELMFFKFHLDWCWLFYSCFEVLLLFGLFTKIGFLVTAQYLYILPI